MSKMMDSRRLDFAGLRRVAALACAAAYLAGGMEVIPQALALGAWLEGSHTVRMASSGEQVTVVLSHERGQPDRPDFTPRHQPGSTLHRHGAAARALCVFVAEQSPQVDHVACFAAGSVCESLSRGIEAKARGVELDVGALAGTVSCVTDSSASPAFRPADFSQPRPPDALPLLRSTVLVI